MGWTALALESDPPHGCLCDVADSNDREGTCMAIYSSTSVGRGWPARRTSSARLSCETSSQPTSCGQAATRRLQNNPILFSCCCCSSIRRIGAVAAVLTMRHPMCIDFHAVHMLPGSNVVVVCHSGLLSKQLTFCKTSVHWQRLLVPPPPPVSTPPPPIGTRRSLDGNLLPFLS